MLLDLLRPQAGNLYLDLGCGEGRVMRELEARGARVHGVDISESLVARTPLAVVSDVADLPFAASSYDGAFSVLTLEHVEDLKSFFDEAARVVISGGPLVVVVNHPAWTAPGSTPIEDSDGEVLWRPGEYFGTGSSEVPAGKASVTFHHRSMSELLNLAARAGWSLEAMAELPHHEITEQAGIPRLLACRWHLLR